MKNQCDWTITRLAHIKWLLYSDRAIHWQVTFDLTDAAPHAIEVERSRIATKGWEPSCSPTTAKMGGPDRGSLIGM